jgi:drug/metabolite transporter (DMT)-like permease
MTVRVLRTTEKMNVVVLYLMICTFVYSIIGCAFTWKSLILPSTTFEIGLLVLQGLFGYGNQVCITKGLSKAKAASVMCMQYFSIVFSQLAGIWFFGEFISFWGNVGMMVIVGSMCVYLLVEAKSKKR